MLFFLLIFLSRICIQPLFAKAFLMGFAQHTSPRTRLAAKLIKSPENISRGDCTMATPRQIKDILNNATENIKQLMISAIKKIPPPETVSFTPQIIEYYTGRDGQNFDKWFRKFENGLKARRYAPSAQAAVAEFACCLKGPAETFFNSLSEHETKDLNSVKEVFSRRFAAKSLHIIWRQKLRSIKQEPGEILDDYTERITDLCQKLNITGDEKMYAFISGLAEDVQEHVLTRSPKTFSEAEEYARLKLSIARAMQNHSDKNQNDPSQKMLIDIIIKLISFQKLEKQSPAQQIAAIDTPIISDENTLREVVRTELRAFTNSINEFMDDAPRQSDEKAICNFCGRIGPTTF